jgi:hypothetical protein
MAQRGQTFFEVVSLQLPFHKISSQGNKLAVAQAKTFWENLVKF